MSLKIRWVGPYSDPCYDDQTEVLTSSGWKFFKDISFEDGLATLNEWHIIEYQKPSHIINREYEGEMYYLDAPRAKINICVTPNHSMYVTTESGRRSGRANAWRLEEARDIYGKTRAFKRDGRWRKKGKEHFRICGRKIKAEHWLEFLGYYLSEGSATIYKRPAGVTKGGRHPVYRDRYVNRTYERSESTEYILQIRQVKGEENRVRMAEAVRRVTNNSVNTRNKDGRILVHDKDLVLYLKRFGNCCTKYIPRDVLNKCSKEQLEVLFEALVLGGGTDNRKKGGGVIYKTFSKRLRDDFLELLLKVGFSGHYKREIVKGEEIRINGRVCHAKEDGWKIGVRFKNRGFLKKSSQCSVPSKHEEKIVPYKGRIYCATVPNHVLFVRRNGCVLWCGNSGYGSNSRKFVHALYKLQKKYDFRLGTMPVSFEKQRADYGEAGRICKRLEEHALQEDIRIINTTPEFYDRLKRPGVLNAAYVTFELDGIPDLWVRELNKMDAVFTTAEFCAEVFRKSGVKTPVFSVPPGLFPEDYRRVEPLSSLDVPEDVFSFYSIFQWTPRKNPQALLHAYWSEFTGQDDVCLVLKTYKNDTSPQQVDMLRRIIAQEKRGFRLDHHPKIFFISQLLSASQLEDLHLSCDAFVSTTAGEGNFIPAFNAMAYAKPVIVTGWSGHTEYCRPEYNYLSKYQLRPAHSMSWCAWNEARFNWADVNILHFRKLMREVYENRAQAKKKAEKGQRFLFKEFSWEKMIKRLVDGIEEVL